MNDEAGTTVVINKPGRKGKKTTKVEIKPRPSYGNQLKSPKKKDKNPKQPKMQVLGTGVRAQQARRPRQAKKHTYRCVGTDQVGVITINAATPPNVVLWEHAINPRAFINTSLALESKRWEKYQIKKLTFRLQSTSGTNTNGTGIGYFETDPVEPTPADPLKEAYAHSNEEPLNIWEHKNIEFPVDERLTDLYVAPNGTDLRMSHAGIFRYVYGGGAAAETRVIYLVSMTYDILFINRAFDTDADTHATIIDYSGGFIGDRWTANPSIPRNDLGIRLTDDGDPIIPGSATQHSDIEITAMLQTDNLTSLGDGLKNTLSREYHPKLVLEGGGATFKEEPVTQQLKAVSSNSDTSTISWILTTTGQFADTTVKVVNAATYASYIALPLMRMWVTPVPKLSALPKVFPKVDSTGKIRVSDIPSLTWSADLPKQAAVFLVSCYAYSAASDWQAMLNSPSNQLGFGFAPYPGTSGRSLTFEKGPSKYIFRMACPPKTWISVSAEAANAAGIAQTLRPTYFEDSAGLSWGYGEEISNANGYYGYGGVSYEEGGDLEVWFDDANGPGADSGAEFDLELLICQYTDDEDLKKLKDHHARRVQSRVAREGSTKRKSCGPTRCLDYSHLQ